MVDEKQPVESIILNLLDQAIEDKISIVAYSIGGPNNIVEFTTEILFKTAFPTENFINLLKRLMADIIEKKVILDKINNRYESLYLVKYTFICDNEITCDHYKELVQWQKI